MNLKERLDHHIRLVLDNEQQTYNFCAHLAEAALASCSSEGLACQRAGAGIKEYVEFLTLRGAHDVMLNEILGVALDCLDWTELAKPYIESAKEARDD